MKLGISSILIHGSLGCRHHLAIQISFYNGVQIHSASIVLTCRLKLKHVSMYTPYRMMHQQLKVSHAVLAAVCLTLSATNPPNQLPPNILFTIFYYLPPKDSSPYNSFSPTIPPISIPHIYYHSLTNYLFNIFEFKKNHTVFVLS